MTIIFVVLILIVFDCIDENVKIGFQDCFYFSFDYFDENVKMCFLNLLLMKMTNYVFKPHLFCNFNFLL